METLPWAAEVLFQDAIYWMENYQQHPLTQFVNKTLPAGYYNYAKAAQLTVATPTLSVAQALNRLPQMPSFNQTLPRNVAQVFYDHRDGDLVRFHDAKKCQWDNNLRLKFRKRKYLYGVMEERELRVNNSTVIRKPQPRQLMWNGMLCE